MGDDMVEITERPVWWTSEGQTVEGVLADVGEVMVGDRVTRRYLIDTADGRLLVWDTAMLRRLLWGIAPGTRVRIVHLGLRPGRRGGQMRMFRVWVQRSAVVTEAGDELRQG